MPEWQSDTFKKGATKLSEAVRGTSQRRKIAMRFAKKHDLIYFQSVQAGGNEAPVLRGTSATSDQVDTNFCIGSHAGYDMAFVERLATTRFPDYKSTVNRWYVLQIDLKVRHRLPFLFVGTKQQSKAYYARLFTARRDARYLLLGESIDKSALFHASYALVASPAEFSFIHTLLTKEVVESMTAYTYPFSLEIEGDSLILTTEATRPSEQLLDKLLHYGLWLAKEIDTRFQ